MSDTQWPPFLSMARVVAYCGMSRTTINRAIESGKLPVYGKPGGVNGHKIFARVAVDRWLSGEDPLPVDANPRPPMPIRPDRVKRPWPFQRKAPHVEIDDAIDDEAYTTVRAREDA